MESKPAYLSKTVLLNALIGIFAVVSSLGFLPSIKPFLEGHTDIILMVMSGIGIGLRMISKGKIDLY